MMEATCNGVVVLPTASGKSLVIRGYCERTTKKVLILSHVREILEQDFECLAGLPDIGLYSAGIGIKHIDRITVAGIQSVWKNPKLFKDFDIVLIDEAHLVSDEGMYKTLLDALGVQYIGLTATDFRMKGGYIHGKDGMFDKVIFEAPVDRLTEEGFLCPLKYFGDKEAFDTDGIKTTGGDFNLRAMSLKFNRRSVTSKIVEQIVALNRKHVLVFCIDIEHAEEVATCFRLLNVNAAAVHSKSPRDKAIQDFKDGKLTVLANVNILTTGFNYPELDTIVILRPTKSMSLHLQMLGRGARIFLGKAYTLVKDFTHNTKLLGTMENPAPLVPKGKRGKGGENPFMKVCGQCDKINHPSVKVCECGYKFKFQHNLKLKAHTEVKRQWYPVEQVQYSLHHKAGSPNSLKVSYLSGLRHFDEYVLVEHKGFAGHKAKRWMDNRIAGKRLPVSASGLLAVSDELRRPRKILVEEGATYPRIITII
jgi:DNA repair protein RadD